MKLDDLKAGMLLRISKNTPNPSRDRRVSRDWRAMDFPEGGELLCRFSKLDAGEGISYSIELMPYAGPLAGANYMHANALHCGWQTSTGNMKGHVKNETQAKLVAALLVNLEPFAPRDVDDAIAVHNELHYPEVSYEHIALTLLDESEESAAAIFERTRDRLKRFNSETDGDDGYDEYALRLREFNAKAYKRSEEPTGDMEPEHTVKKGGTIECHGCGRTFTSIVTSSAVAVFTGHLPCKGKE